MYDIIAYIVVLTSWKNMPGPEKCRVKAAAKRNRAAHLGSVHPIRSSSAPTPLRPRFHCDPEKSPADSVADSSQSSPSNSSPAAAYAGMMTTRFQSNKSSKWALTLCQRGRIHGAPMTSATKELIARRGNAQRLRTGEIFNWIGKTTAGPWLCRLMDICS